MCTTCGCSDSTVRVTDPEGHSHRHPSSERGHTIALEQRVLARNDELAEANRAWLTARGALAVNLMVSCRIANVRMEETVRWVGWMLFAMFLVMVAVIVWPQLALWLPARLGY